MLADTLVTADTLTPEQHAEWRGCFALPVPPPPAVLTVSDPMRALYAKYKLTKHCKMLPAQVPPPSQKALVAPPFAPL